MLTIGNQYSFDSDIQYGDKSITHRALILASIADDVVHITNASTCLDCMSTINCLRTLGANISVQGTTIIVNPITNANSGVVLDCGNSGTTARLLAGLVAGLDIDATLVGDSSLSTRPMDRVVDPLTLMGANITVDEHCIMRIHSTGTQLQGISYTMPVASAQVKSSILIAGLFAKGTTTVVENISTRDHTERMLDFFGVLCQNVINTTVCKAIPHARDIDVPNDMSTAIYGIVLALSSRGGCFANVGINEGRLGAVNALIDSGANITLTNKALVSNEWRADIVVKPSKCSALHCDHVQSVAMIDDVLAILLVATTVNDTSVLCGLGELRHKESDRLQAIVQYGTQLGASVTVQNDDIYIRGNDSDVPHMYIFANGDHRSAMMGVIAGLVHNGVTIDDHQCIDVSCKVFLQWLGISYRRYALIGESVGNSLSPLICSVHARLSGINSSYQCISIGNASDAQLLDIASRYDGVNVTMPYKERMAMLLGSSIGSINTISNGNITASTDGIGMLNALVGQGIDVANSNILIIGAGGASRSICSTLIDSGANITVVNRTQQRADKLNAELGNSVLDRYDGVISCVPPCSYELDAVRDIDNVKWVASVSYKSDSMLRVWAENGSIKYIDGMAMLYYQARASYNIWNNTSVADGYSIFREMAYEYYGNQRTQS